VRKKTSRFSVNKVRSGEISRAEVAFRRECGRPSARSRMGEP